MTVLLLFLPLALFVAAGEFWQSRIRSLAGSVTEACGRALRQQAEEQLTRRVESIAVQCGRHLEARPGFDHRAPGETAGLKSVAVQPITGGGWTTLYERQSPGGAWRVRAQADSPSGGRRPQKAENSRRQRLLGSAGEHGLSAGYLEPSGPDGTTERYFMTCASVPQTPFVVAAESALEGVRVRVGALEAGARGNLARARRDGWIVLAAALLLLGLPVLIYGRRPGDTGRRGRPR